MTASDVIAALFSPQQIVTRARIQKAQRLADRGGLRWPLVVAAMTAEQRTAIAEAVKE